MNCFVVYWTEFFAGSDSPYRESLNETLNQLSADVDRDVSYYATVKRDQTPWTADHLQPATASNDSTTNSS